MIVSHQELINEISVRAWNSPRNNSIDIQRVWLRNNSWEIDAETAFTHTICVNRGVSLLSHFGLNHITLPSADSLNRGELNSLVKAFVELLISWSIIPEFSQRSSVEARYELLCRCLIREVPILSSGYIKIDFTAIEPPEANKLA